MNCKYRRIECTPQIADRGCNYCYALMNAVEKWFSDEGTKKAGRILTSAGFCF